jgi:N-methylhydantoinase A
MSLRVAIDIGGGFVDLVAVDEQTGAMSWSKARTTPADFSRYVEHVFKLSGVNPPAVSQLLHGQTLVINTILQRNGARTGLITTRGFRDILQLQRANRRDIFNLRYQKPEPFVPRHLRLEADERTLADGTTARPLDRGSLLDAYRKLLAEGVEAVAIAFINSYANAANEVEASKVLAAWNRESVVENPPPVSISCDISREWREYERTNTCVLNAYVRPLVDRYLQKLATDFDRMGMKGTLYMMLSGGGIATFDYAARFPIETVESGPVAGVVGAIAIAKRVGARHIIAMDGGSTTTKASLVHNLTLRFSSDYAVERDEFRPGYPIKVPVVDINEIGIGGGSIAWVNEVGTLKVGPRNAGADPGPACYGLGGEEPTLTDAYLVAGFLNPEYFLGGAMKVHGELSDKAIGKIANCFAISVADAAQAMLRTAHDNAAQLLRLISVQRGYDPRDFALVVYGGSGPMIAPFIAEELEIPQIIVPAIPPGNFSAWGLLMSDLRHTMVQTLVRRLDDPAVAGSIHEHFLALEAKAVELFREEGTAGQVQVQRSADLRYAGQEHTITVPALSGEFGLDAVEALMNTFQDHHQREYGFRLESPVEVVNLRVTGVVRARKPELQRLRAPAGVYASPPERFVGWSVGARISTPVYRREYFAAGQRVAGPAIVEEPTTTILIPPAFQAVVDEWGNLILERK